MLRVLQSPSAAERVAAASEFIQSFAAATEFLLVGKTYQYSLTALGKQVITLRLKLKELYIIPQLFFADAR